MASGLLDRLPLGAVLKANRVPLRQSRSDCLDRRRLGALFDANRFRSRWSRTDCDVRLRAAIGGASALAALSPAVEVGNVVADRAPKRDKWRSAASTAQVFKIPLGEPKTRCRVVRRQVFK